MRERALADARQQVNVLLKELATDRAELRARDARIADLESQVEEHRRQLATVIARAIAKNRVLPVQKPRSKIQAKPAASKPTKRRQKKVARAAKPVRKKSTTASRVAAKKRRSPRRTR